MQGAEEALREDAVQVAILVAQAVACVQGSDATIVDLKKALEATSGILSGTSLPTYSAAQTALKSAQTPVANGCKG